MGAAAVLAMDWDECPQDVQKPHRPLCHTSDGKRRAAYRTRVRATTDQYRAALARWRKLKPDPGFPKWTFPPGHARCVGAPDVPEPRAARKAPA